MKDYLLGNEALEEFVRDKESFSKCLKTSVSVFPSHYMDVCERLKDKWTIVNSEIQEAKDFYYEEYL